MSTGSLNPFIEQTVFYAKAFSAGYFNSEMERSVSHAYFHSIVFDEYLDSVTIYWEITKLVFLGFVIFGIANFFSPLKNKLRNKLVLTTALFGLILTRSALGRSDWYHLLFVSGIALLLIFYLLSKLYESHKFISVALTLLLVLVLVRPNINNVFLEKTLFTFQTYGKLTAEYNQYDFNRGGILIGKEIDSTPVNKLVNYIEKNSSKQDKIFVYPWNPEIYFYSDRINATKFDTPYAFYTPYYQKQIIDQLKATPPKFIIYNNDMNFGNLTTGSLQSVTDYIQQNFEQKEIYGPYAVLIAKTPSL